MGILSDFGYTDDNNSSYDEPPRPQETVPPQKDMSLPDAIIKTANDIGINPLDLATAISYETGGTFNPRLLGPQTKNGQGRGIGLIQFMSNGAAKDYGITQDTPAVDQLKAAGRYLVDRGVKAGMGLLDIYSAINAGRVGLYDRSDANNGGAPGTVRDKVENQMAGHRIKAAKLLGFRDFSTPQVGVTPAATPNYPGYVAPSGPRREGSAPGVAYVSDNNGGWRPAEPGEVPEAMFYGEPRNHPRATPAYIRSGTPGVQASYVPPEMRGPFLKPTPGKYATGTVGAPTTDAMPDMNVPAMPGTAQEPMPAIDEQLAKLLISNVPDEPNLMDESAGLNLDKPNLMDESAGLNLAKTAPNISIPSQDTTPNVLSAPPTVTPPDNPVPAPAPAPVPAPVTTPAPTPDEPSAFDRFIEGAKSVLNDTQTGIRQFGAKAVGAINAMPSQAVAGVLSVPALAGYDETLPAAQAVLDYAERGKKAANTIFGVDDNPKTLFQGASVLAGRNVTPMGKYTLAASGISAGVDAASHIIERAQASTVTKKEAEQLLFPGIGNDSQHLPGPRLSQTVETSAGPVKLDPANYKLLGVIGAATIGAVAMPAVAKLLFNSKLGQSLLAREGRDVLNAPPGVESFTNRMDLLHTTTHDSAATVMRLARGLGVDPLVIDNMRINFDFQTGGAARGLTNSAIINGELRSPNFSYKVNTPVLKLAEAETPDTMQYMHLQHLYDQIREQERIAMKKTPAAAFGGAASIPAGPVFVRGMDKATVLQRIRTMEASPEGQAYKDFHSTYQENLKAFRDFMYRGEYGTMSRDAYKEARLFKPSEIFQKDLDLGNTDAPLLKSSQTLGEEMQTKMRERMENEAKGYYIDQMVMHEPRFAQQVSAEEFRKNEKSWERNTVTFYRRGKKEYWVTDPTVAFTLKMDPYFMSGVMGGIITGARKTIETTTTGRLAPWFAFTNAARNYHLARVSPEPGFVAPNVGNVIAAVPQTLYPQAAKFIAGKLDDYSGGYLGRVLGPSGPQILQAASRKLASVFDQSTLAALDKRGGVHTSGFINYNQEASGLLKQAAQSAPVSAAKTFLHGLSHTLEAIHNSSNFAYAKKNIKRGVPVERAAMSARQLTGDPQKFGQFVSQSKGVIPFNDEGSTIFGKAATKGVKTIGGAFEVGRQAFPWFNVTTQGMKRVGQAYLDNPAKFVQRMYLNSMLPAAAIYMYTRGLGVDPNGISYSDYQMNRRSPYKSLMFWYVPIPGRPAEDGLEIPLPHETAAASSMVMAALHHLTHSELFSRGDDYIRAALSFVNQDYKPAINVPVRTAEADFANIAKNVGQIALMPALPAFFSAPIAAVGYVAPQGPFSEAYKRHDDPYDDKQGMNTTFELLARAIMPGIADVLGSGWAAYTHSPDAFSGIGAGAKATTRRVTEKTPFVRDMVGWKPPVAGSTQITDDLFSDKGVLTKLDQYYKNFDPTIDRSNRRERGSAEGRIVAEHFMPGLDMPKQTLGIPPAPPTNALYMAFMKEVDRRFHKDTVSDKGEGKLPSGGIGFPSQMAKYSIITRQIKDMRKIDDGNSVKWKDRIEHEPELYDFLEAHKIPIDDPRTVRNFLEQQRQTAARQIMFTIKAVEQDFQQRLGDPNFSFEKLDPYQPYLLPPGVQIPEFVPKWPSYAGELGLNVPHGKSHHKQRATALPPQ